MGAGSVTPLDPRSTQTVELGNMNLVLIGAYAAGRPLAPRDLDSGEERGEAKSPARDDEDGTRERVLRIVVERGPVTATELAAQLGITSTAVRRHLDALVERGQLRTISRPSGPRGRGRPARAYVASLGAHRDLVSEYDDVAMEALRFLAEQVGPDAVAAFAKKRVAGLEERYGEVVRAAGPDVRDRTEALAAALAQDGFAATARPLLPLADTPRTDGLANGVQLCQGHCPVHEVAREFPEFCEAETDAFARLLGVHVQRLATLAGGGHVCTTYVPAAALAGTAPSPPGDPPKPNRPPHPRTPVHPDERTAR